MTTMARIVLALCALLCVVSGARGGLRDRHLQRTYKLTVGRSTACPRSLRIGRVRGALTVPARDMTADGARCSGRGGKVLRSGSYLRSAGLRLPGIVGRRETRFFAGVESATRVCGGWAFNASATSWFIASPRAFRDKATGVYIRNDHLYAAYSHFATLCVYQSWLSPKERTEIAKPEARSRATSDQGAATVGKRACFPAHARVVTPHGVRRVEQLRVGDVVMAAPGVFSPIAMFSHRDAQATSRFVTLFSRSNTLSLSHGHLLYVNGQLKAAESVRVGDSLRLEDGSTASVEAVDQVEASGLYAPHTLHGDIVVDGVAASCYTTAVKARVAHALLAPLRVPLFSTSPWFLHHLDRLIDMLRAAPELPSVLTGAA